MSVQSERITILGTPAFKKFLLSEAKKEGVSMSELVRQRCSMRETNKDDELLAALVEEVSKATKKAQKTLEKGLADAENALSEIRRKQQ